MLQIASQKSFKEGLVFLLPCAVIYQKIGEYLSSITPSVNSYSCWIAHYGSTEKQQKVEGLIHIVDQLVASCSKDEIQDLKEVFCKAALYELDFWEDAYQRMSWP